MAKVQRQRQLDVRGLISASIREKDFQQMIVDYAQLRGWLVYHPYDSRHSAAGYPDLTLVRGDRLIFAEIKTAMGKVSNEQIEWKTGLEMAGQMHYLWRPDDWQEIVEVLA